MTYRRSTAQMAGHPVHPMFVPFPIAFWLAALFCDISFVSTGQSGWPVGAVWLVGAGLVFALVAAVFGFVDFLGEARIRELRHAWEHMIGNLTAAALAAISLSLRLISGPAEAVVPWGLTLSTLIAIILLFTGWRGADLVYKHGTGVAHESATEAVQHTTKGSPIQ